MKLGDLYVNDI